jgi:EPS-associated MarR family transcriptional regulator
MPLSSQDEKTFRVLRFLERDPSLSQRDLARETGWSLGAVNYCLQALVAKGEVKIENFRTSDNRMKYIYVLTPKGVQKRLALTRDFLKRKQEEYHSIKAEIEELEAETALLDQDQIKP